MDPARTPDRHLILRIVAAVFSLLGMAGIITQVFGIVSMRYALTFVGIPAFLAVLTLATIARRLQAEVYLNALWVGTVGGLVATGAYDLSRLLLMWSGIFQFNAFGAIPIFGSWITNTPSTSDPAQIAGWIYHFWNGISFGIFYSLVFGRGHWILGVLYGVAIEMMMLGVFPYFVPLTDVRGMITISVIGHVFYGGTLGLFAKRYGKNWDQTDAKPSPA